ncbi:MAG: crossover junction endodeoxyribonuclease RuvC [Candidatus Paceibacterota bacterium]|jgi:crossover junction endodeoxyribonuclease RuvC|nr:crossover junction endodeoxyribonuclease RuvC [Candidatus Paceibacterota bacterium]MDD4830834.1 crossover junction endodeoxyribonuclease RuvC [Candidatus Paceibacterota bacterium]MDD4874915.1 crossover junction endodeoxyribonuclease RuvC [Candidatus Paceibacterota bacterium]
MIILGIDPGTATTGYGVIESKILKEKKDRILSCVDYGVIKTSSKSEAGRRLVQISSSLVKLIDKYEPRAVVIESLYFFKNLKTAMPVSQARGVILLETAKKGIPIYEFTPLQIKTSVCGYGRAEKLQVQKMVQFLLKLKKLPKPDDAADALAAAICGSDALKLAGKS